MLRNGTLPIYIIQTISQQHLILQHTNNKNADQPAHDMQDDQHLYNSNS